jgi:hypothetical protein
VRCATLGFGVEPLRGKSQKQSLGVAIIFQQSVLGAAFAKAHFLTIA